MDLSPGTLISPDRPELFLSETFFNRPFASNFNELHRYLFNFGLTELLCPAKNFLQFFAVTVCDSLF